MALLAGWKKLSRRLLLTSAVLIALLALLPMGEWLAYPLETRFQTPANLPSQVAGVIVLGGSIAPGLSFRWRQPQLNNSAERLTAFLDLARRFPDARLVFSGGSGSLTEQELKEADIAGEIFSQLGFSEYPIEFERESRNTFENAVNSKRLVQPRNNDSWILVTSALHMPRAMGVFCQQNWQITPYPVDYLSSRQNLLRLEYGLAQHLSTLEAALREWVGLLAYRVTGKSSALLPQPGALCH